MIAALNATIRDCERLIDRLFLLVMVIAATAIDQWVRACQRYAAGRLDGSQFRLELMALLAESALTEPHGEALLHFIARATNNRPAELGVANIPHPPGQSSTPSAGLGSALAPGLGYLAGHPEKRAYVRPKAVPGRLVSDPGL